jgi:hypothetical protein
MTLFQLLYLSRTTLAWSPAELERLVTLSQQRNAADDLTGLLLYGRGHFVQLLEGRRQALLLTFDRISRDTRHADVQVLLDGRIEQRAFAGWSMGLINVDHAGEVDRSRFDRIIRAFQPGAGPVAGNALAVQLLKEFRAHAAEAAARPARLPDWPDPF